MKALNYRSKDSNNFITSNNQLRTIVVETSKVKVYEHPLFGKVRMFIENGRTWFCGTDIATSLGYSNPRDAIVRHCKSHGVLNHDVIDSMGRTQQMKFISEGNIYRLTAKSQMPKADDFESWIFDEIVPSVVNTGSYSVQPQTPQTYLEALKALVSSEEEKQRLAQEKQQLEEKNAKLQPKADFADAAFRKIHFLFGDIESIRIFAVLQIIIYYAKGIFYAQKASIFKIYREVVSVYHSRWQMIVCSKIGYDFSFFINNK